MSSEMLSVQLVATKPGRFLLFGFFFRLEITGGLVAAVCMGRDIC